jgi:hypothetical protein
MKLIFKMRSLQNAITLSNTSLPMLVYVSISIDAGSAYTGNKFRKIRMKTTKS